MKNMIDFIITTLLPLNVTVAFNALPAGSDPPDQYITFTEYFLGAELEAADTEIITRRLIQVNVWSKGDYGPLAHSVRTLLEEAGFERTAEFDAPYSDGDSHFNRVLRFKFVDEY